MVEQVTGFTAARTQALEDMKIVSAEITENKRLILKNFKDEEFDAGEVWPEPDHAAVYKIAEVELGADAATIDFTGIPGTFKHLKIVGSVRAAVGGTDVANLLLKVNNVTGPAGYNMQQFTGNGGAATAAEALGAGNAQMMGAFPAALASAGSMAQFEITICDYADAAKIKPIHVVHTASWGGTTGKLLSRQTNIIWLTAAAINRLTFLANAGNMLAGSQISVYGFDSAFWVSPSKRYMFDGQSLGYSPFVTEQAYPYKFMQMARPHFRHFVANLPGTTYAQRAPSLPGRLDHLFATTPKAILFDDGGTYDLDAANGNMSSAAVLAAKTAYTAARRAAGCDYIVGITIPPAVILTAAEETNRQAVNAAMVANPGTYGYDEVVNLDAIPQLTDPNNTTYFYDGVHYSDAATTLVAQALAATGV